MSNVYGNKVMSDGCVQKWTIKSKEGDIGIHEQGGQGRKIIATDNIKQVNRKICGRSRFTISKLSANSSHISRSACSHDTASPHTGSPQVKIEAI